MTITYVAAFEPEMRMNYEVVLCLEIKAQTPEQAAAIARDIMLDPDSKLCVAVHDIVYVEDADDWMPDTDYGWQMWFRGSVEPTEITQWRKKG